jgi:hypothetical protein
MANQGQSSKKPLADSGAKQGVLSAVHQRRIRTACMISRPGYDHRNIELAGNAAMSCGI